MEGISAMHVGDVRCFMLLRMADSPTTLLSMYNVEFLGFSPEKLVYRREESFGCPEKAVVVQRAEHVLVSYLDADVNQTMVVHLSGRDAWAMQHVGLHNLGYSICNNDDRKDEGARTLQEILSFV